LTVPIGWRTTRTGWSGAPNASFSDFAKASKAWVISVIAKRPRF
jgi:hypothetical protein